MMEKSNKSFFVICVGRFFFIPIENGRLVRKIYSSFFYMSLKRNFCERVLWIETFIRNTVFVASSTSLTSLFPAKNRSTINFVYCIVQGTVAETPKTSSTKSVDEIAKEVIRGDWGNGEERKKKLTAAGYDYSVIQKKVNEMLK